MAKKGGKRRIKRSGAPAFWVIPRKRYQFTVRTSPGTHRFEESYPLAVLLRDILKLVKTFREAGASINDGKILVDGVVRRNPAFPVGLMDVVQIPSIGKAYRMLPFDGSALRPVEIPEAEKSLKLCKVTSKTTVRRGRIQMGFHDGRTLESDEKLKARLGDVYLMEVPTQKVVRVLETKKGATALVLRGKRAGSVGRIEQVKPGTLTRRHMAAVSFDRATVELPLDILMAVGGEKPLISIGQEAR